MASKPGTEEVATAGTGGRKRPAEDEAPRDGVAPPPPADAPAAAAADAAPAPTPAAGGGSRVSEVSRPFGSLAAGTGAGFGGFSASGGGYGSAGGFGGFGGFGAAAAAAGGSAASGGFGGFGAAGATCCFAASAAAELRRVLRHSRAGGPADGAAPAPTFGAPRPFGAGAASAAADADDDGADGEPPAPAPEYKPLVTLPEAPRVRRARLCRPPASLCHTPFPAPLPRSLSLPRNSSHLTRSASPRCVPSGDGRGG